MDVRFVPMAEFGLTGGAELLTRAFADYFVTIAFSEEGLGRMAKLDSVEFSLSPVMILKNEAVGAALIARRGNASRLAGMALLPHARKQGAGRALMTYLLREASERGDARMGLEVIEQNVPAVKLYEAMGFRKIRRLVGFAGAPPEGLEPEPGLEVVSVQAVAAAVAGMEPAIGWPWQLSAETVAQLPPPASGYTLDGASVLVLNPAGPVVGLRGLAVEGGLRRAERAARLLRAVMARHPAKEWRFSAMWPEELAVWFERAGLPRQQLTQWQMVREPGREE